jgi:hypothetical protein
VRTLDTFPELREPAMDTLASLVHQFGNKFQVFIPMIHRVLKKHNIKHSRYETLILYKSKSDDQEIMTKNKRSRTIRNMGLTAADTTSINRVGDVVLRTKCKT